MLLFFREEIMNDIFERVERNIDQLVLNDVGWAVCATPQMLENARAGKPELPFGPGKTLPMDWVEELQGKKVLCLAGAGGLQAPILACAGAEVTVIDLSERMLDKDRLIAARENLTINMVHGNMCDLSRFRDETFDLVLNPPSLFYVPDVMPVFREVHRVLKAGGSFLMISSNPIAYVCDWDANIGCYKAVNRMPYRSYEHDDQGEWVEFGHTMENYLGGQIEAGFIITGYLENQTDDITELYFATRAVKL